MAGMANITGMVGTFTASLPSGLAVDPTYYDDITGRNASTGNMLVREIAPSGTDIRIRTYDNQFPAADGSIMHLFGVVAIADLL